MTRGGRPIVAIDLETGGFEPGRHSILAIGGYWQDFCGKEHKLRLLCERVPSTVVEPAAAAKCGWESDEQWLGLGAVPLREALELTEEWMGRLALELGVERLEPLAHNHASVDRPFLDYWQREYSLTDDFKALLSHAWHDSMTTLRAAQVAGLVPNGRGASLDAMLCYMGRSRSGAVHDAAEDAKGCFDGYHWLVELMRAGRRAV